MSSPKPIAPSSPACTRPGLTDSPPKSTGNAKIGSENSPATPMIELTASPPAAWTVSMPVPASIRYCTLAPTASPPGSVLVTALPARPAVTTANQFFVRSTRRSSAIAQKKLAASAEERNEQPPRLEGQEPGP